MTQKHKKYPAVTGLFWHREQYYSFFIPNHWHRLAWSDGREGVIYAPEPTDPLTVFAVDIKDLGTPLTADDLQFLAEGYFEGISQLPDCAIESQSQKSTGSLLELEAKYTFHEQGQTRKRWARVFYYAGQQIAMTAQGATPAQYDYWLPWFFEAMMTAKLHMTKPESPY